MRTASQLLAALRERNIQLTAADGKLRFEAPKGALTPDLQDELRRRKPEVMALLAAEIERPPLSFAQQRLWFLDQLEGGGSVYNIPLMLRLRGELDVDALRKTLDALAERHESLRTSFGEHEGQPYQRIAPAGPVRLDISEAAAQTLHERLTALAGETFNLAQGPLLRASLLRLGQSDHILALVMHHIISDGWSMAVLAQEFSRLYAAFHGGQPNPLPPLPLQYRDFAQQQRRWFETQGKTSLAYWKQQLADAPDQLHLPLDFARPAIQRFKGAVDRFNVPVALAEALRQLARGSGTSLFVLLQAAFAVLLSRHSGMDDIVIGTPIAGRNRAELEPLIGIFINMLALRTRLVDNPRFAEVLAGAHHTAMDAFEHQSVPFGQLVEALHPVRSLSHSPVFQVSFALQNAPEGKYELPGLAVEPMDFGWNSSAYDLALMCWESTAGLLGVWEYDTALFRADSIARMSEHFLTLLAGIVHHPACRIGELPLLPPDEKRRLLYDWNATARDYPTDCVHRLFEAQAQASPDLPALVYDGGGWSYRELNERANRLAHYLLELGLGAETIAAFSFRHEPEAIVALLAILKAGAAYVALDPDYPAERVAFMLQDTGARWILTSPALAERFAGLAVRVFCLDTEETGLARFADSNPDSDAPAQPAAAPSQLAAAPAQLAAVYYTSGTTGQPKGTLLEHRNLAHHAQAMREAYALTAQDRVLQFTSYSFDVALEELFPTWLAGGTVVQRPKDLPSISNLMRYAQDHGVTVMNLPTGYWHEWALQLDACPPPPSVRLVITGNDKVLRERLALWRAKLPDVAWRDAYGASEATVTNTVYDPEGSEPGVSDGVPIGKPIANTRVYLLDACGQPVPQGVVGEAYIAGAGVARGYLNRPDLTESRFLADPFAPGRMYRTGDLFRYLADGNLEFLGRIDRQVKIRGFRVELAEIEAALAEHPLVREAVVMARPDNFGHLQLAAYLVAAEHVETSGFADFLKTKLPAYMVPRAFVALDALPVTAVGKIDWKALPAPGAASFAQSEFDPPESGTERVLADIWQHLLSVERVGRHDSFFDLGGHSLLVTNLLHQIHQVLSVDMSVQSLFLYPSLTAFAEQVDLALGALQEKSHQSHQHTSDWLAEIELAPAVSGHGLPPGWQPGEPLRNVLLTGGTGFLGAFLLHELLRQTEATVHCLVRAVDAEEADARLRGSLAQYGLWDETLAGRIVALAGNLAQPRLGLAEAQWLELAATLDAIYHNGAWVNFLYPYETLKAANVGGTLEIIQLAATARLKPVHYVSTISLFPRTMALCREAEALDLDVFASGGFAESGYLASKWVSERLLVEAGRRGIPESIYRPGQILGHSETGAFNLNDLFTRDIKTCLQLGIYPLFDNSHENLAPVDYVSRAIVHLSRQAGGAGKAFHLMNPTPSWRNDFIDHALRLGYDLQGLPFDDWKARVADACKGNPHIGLHPLLPMLAHYAAPEASDWMHIYDCGNALAGLAGTDIRCPAITPALLDVYFRYLIAHGGFPPPAGNQAGLHGQ